MAARIEPWMPAPRGRDDVGMARYAIGDVQGCARSLKHLLRKLPVPTREDRLWLVGDLVNRGPRSLEVLRWAKDQGPRVSIVLGNHDIHLLSCAAGVRETRSGDTLDEVLAAPDLPELMDWLRQRPFVHNEGGITMVHAGLLPEWTVERAAELGAELSAALSGPDWHAALRAMATPAPDRWDDGLAGTARLSTLAAAFTRLRTCTADGRMCLKAKGPPDSAPEGCLPWFDVPDRASARQTVVCGHWAALGLHLGDDVLSLDSGCVWGGELSALRLEDRALFQQANVEAEA
jgi:bis(5'-nucleosyl)-tetraphosphatase (symmetrical)